MIRGHKWRVGRLLPGMSSGSKNGGFFFYIYHKRDVEGFLEINAFLFRSLSTLRGCESGE